MKNNKNINVIIWYTDLVWIRCLIDFVCLFYILTSEYSIMSTFLMFNLTVLLKIMRTKKDKKMFLIPVDP